MKFNYLNESKLFFDKFLSKKYKRPQGCKTSEILELEGVLGCKLPQAYKEYLLWMGKFSQGPFCGSNFFLKDILENKCSLQDLLKENNLHHKFQNDILVFFTHQGYIAAWFSLPVSSEDPTVIYFSEGETNQPKEVCSFSEFLLGQLQTIYQYTIT